MLLRVAKTSKGHATITVMVKSHQLNLRLATDVHAVLNKISEETDIAPTTLAAQILTEYVQFYYYKIHRGDVTISQHVLKQYLKTINPSKIDEMATNVANYILSEMRIQEGKLDYDIVSQRILKWNKGNHLILNKFSNKDSDVFIAKHELGKNWSEIQCSVYTKAFKNIGETVLDSEFDECSFSIELAKHKT